MSLFVRITAIAAVAIVALIVLSFVLKIVFFAAIVAAIVVGALALYNLFRRRRHGALTLTVRR
jgi:hypothetical protein